MSQARALYHLQTLELRRRAVERRLQEIAAALADDEKVAAAQQEVAAAAGQLNPTLARQRELEHALAANEAKAKATDERLYSGAVSNPKELADMQQELTALQRRRDELEDELLQTMEAADAANAVMAGAQDELQRAEAARAEDNAELIAERAELTNERARLTDESEVALAAVEADALATYRTLAKQKKGRALALIREGRCLACGVSLSTGLEQRVRHGRELTACQSCGRLLVAE